MEIAGLRRYGLEEIEFMKRDLNKTPVGRADNGEGGTALTLFAEAVFPPSLLAGGV